jgi:hypothetical protein
LRPTDHFVRFVRSWRPLFANGQLLATFAIGFCILFTPGGDVSRTWTFHLAAPPYSLSTVALGWLFVVYLVGIVITPFGGRWIDRYGHRTGLAMAMALGAPAPCSRSRRGWRDRRRSRLVFERRVHRAGGDQQLHRRVTTAIAPLRSACTRPSTTLAAASGARRRRALVERRLAGVCGVDSSWCSAWAW